MAVKEAGTGLRGKDEPAARVTAKVGLLGPRQLCPSEQTMRHRIEVPGELVTEDKPALRRGISAVLAGPDPPHVEQAQVGQVEPPVEVGIPEHRRNHRPRRRKAVLRRESHRRDLTTAPSEEVADDVARLEGEPDAALSTSGGASPGLRGTGNHLTAVSSAT